MMRAIVFVFFLSLSPLTTAAQVSDDLLIVPGVRIGKWTLEMSIEDLTRMNGLGSSTVPPTSPLYVGAITRVTWTTNPLTAFTRDQRKIEALCIDEGAFRTEKIIQIGSSTRSSVIAAYRNPTVVIALSPTTAFLVYDEIGASFRIANERVDSMCVFRTRTAATIWRSQATTPTPTPTATPRNGY
jgi:hypothetical protein